MPVHLNNSKKRLVLPRSRILRGRGSFDRVFERSHRIKGRTVDVRFLFIPHDPPEWFVGFVSGKKTGNAVIRNRNKRLMREAFRLNQQILDETDQLLSCALHIVFIAHKGGKSFEHAEKDIKNHLEYIRQAIRLSEQG